MATNAENSKAPDLESGEASQSEEEIREAAQTDKVVRGVNGGLAPKARNCARWRVLSSSSWSCLRRRTCGMVCEPNRKPQSSRTRRRSA